MRNTRAITDPRLEAATARIVDQVMHFATAPAAVIAWLTSLGCTVTLQEGRASWHIHGIAGGMTACSATDDPITVASSLAFALAGQWWPQAFPTLMDDVSKAWTARRRAATPLPVPPDPDPPPLVTPDPLVGTAQQLSLF